MHYPLECEVRETKRLSHIFLSPKHDGPLVSKRTASFKMNSEGGSEALAAQLQSAHQQETMKTKTDRGPTEGQPKSKGVALLLGAPLPPFLCEGLNNIPLPLHPRLPPPSICFSLLNFTTRFFS